MDSQLDDGLAEPLPKRLARQAVEKQSHTGRTLETIGVGTCRGTLGELFQGPIARGNDLEIAIASLPIRKGTVCKYTIPARELAEPYEGLDGRPKTARALSILVSQHKLRLPPGHFHFSSELEVGKGMASSTADIVAAIRCVGRVVHRHFRVRDIMNVLRLVERSDSVFLRSGALYLSERHEVVLRFGRTLSYTAAFLMEPGVVETDSTRACLLEHYRRDLSKYREVLQQFVLAAVQRDPYLVAAAATCSARLSQRCLPKGRFPAMCSAMRALGADGVFVAHTGSVLGYLYVKPPSSTQRSELSSFFNDIGASVRIERVGWTNV